jgi:sec-independent protein translocase protein TatC
MSGEPDNVQEDADKEMPFLEHLIELRSRILRSMTLVGVLFVPIYYFAGPLFSFVSAPLVQALPDGSSMIATAVTSPFLTPFKLAIYTAIFIGIPFLLHQLWGFVSPGLYRSEKRFAFPLLFSSIVLFYAGMAFSYFLVFPLVFTFLVAVSPEGVPMMTDINQYLDFVLKMFLPLASPLRYPLLPFCWLGQGSPALTAWRGKGPTSSSVVSWRACC